ncbi:hypothetical protein C8A03DRAFT_35283 [Achaetomium macrosporum]|uniref:Uncharacterized protein n=1 Tax=Achaetomium macrosporum TaxID=79813 RepID=A0AAN7HAY2_9PEZI|nr:hypothetical protein C8A03DRAFT_35283 [Achaetomium macrosporum]
MTPLSINVAKARENGQSEETSIYHIALDRRSRLGGDPLETYLGDAFLFATIALPLATVLGPSSSEAPGTLAETQHAALDGISRADLLAALGAAHNLEGYGHPAYSLAGASMIVVPQDYISLPALDFGPAIGTPDCERPPADEWNDFFRRTVILPAAAGTGLKVLVALGEEEMRRLKADEEFEICKGCVIGLATRERTQRKSTAKR